MASSNYNDSTIVSMKFLSHLREKSGMYGFQLHNIQGLWQQLKEVVDNSADEALDPNKVYPIDITFFGRSFRVSPFISKKRKRPHEVTSAILCHERDSNSYACDGRGF